MDIEKNNNEMEALAKDITNSCRTIIELSGCILNREFIDNLPDQEREKLENSLSVVFYGATGEFEKSHQIFLNISSDLCTVLMILSMAIDFYASKEHDVKDLFSKSRMLYHAAQLLASLTANIAMVLVYSIENQKIIIDYVALKKAMGEDDFIRLLLEGEK